LKTECDIANSAVFLKGDSCLIAGDAVAALLVLEDGRFLMQLRDPKPEIFYPDHWGCFGGAIDVGESAINAMKRELNEELELEIDKMVPFVSFDFDLTVFGQKRVSRAYFEIPITEAQMGSFVLHEGTRFEAISANELLTLKRVTPYDAFAIWLHVSKRRLIVSGEAD
jgi:8-oxo-dGTP pyrophosphatase MutT (NUDIX family)